MFNRPYTTNSFISTVPLCYDTIYYVESPDNDVLNRTMLQLLQDGHLFYDSEMMSFPIKLQYVSQKELSGDYLQSQLGDGYDDENVNDAIYDLRKCLSADVGGTLTACYMPRKGSESTREDICSLSLIEFVSPERAVASAKKFAKYLAETDFERVMGVSYQQYLKDYEDLYNPPLPSFGYTMGYMRTTVEPEDVVRIIKSKLKNVKGRSTLSILEILKSDIKRIEDMCKLDIFCPLSIYNDEIWLNFPDHEKMEVTFGRGSVAKALYIFYLQHIERVQKNPKIPRYVSQSELYDYIPEIKKIYEKIKNKKVSDNDIASWCDKSINTFSNAISSINKFFKREFDLELIKKKEHKSYLLEIKGMDGNGNSRYGIDLEPYDFYLDDYSIDRMENI